MKFFIDTADVAEIADLTESGPVESARLGAHVVTLPPKVLRDLALHPLTDKGLAAFVKGWDKTGQRIL